MIWAITESLLAFDDAKARATADELMTDKELLEFVRPVIEEKGPRGFVVVWGSSLIAVALLLSIRNVNHNGIPMASISC
jgi:hypothetical protein